MEISKAYVCVSVHVNEKEREKRERYTVQYKGALQLSRKLGDETTRQFIFNSCS